MLHLLGTGAPFLVAGRTTTMLAVESDGAVLLVDCGGDAVERMQASGLNPAHLTGLIVTHAHADHLGGLPLLVEKLWLGGRTAPLPVYGIASALDVARRLLDLFGAPEWKGLFEIVWTEIPERPRAEVVDDAHFRVVASPVVHALPNVGLRIETKADGHALAYSSDTEPCDAVVDLARGARLLVHEATGEGPGHSSAEQAAAVAQQSGVPLLVLVHLPPGLSDHELADARAVFPATVLGKEGGRLRV